MTTTPDPDVTVYVGIGNSDDKLTQMAWSIFAADVRELGRVYAIRFLGEWYSLPNRRYQNAEFAWVMRRDCLDALRSDLADLRKKYVQDSIALAIVQETELI